MQPSVSVLTFIAHSILLIRNADCDSCAAARLKEIPLTLHSVETTKPEPDYALLKCLPKDPAPMLIAEYHNGERVVLTQSLNIIDFLEDSFPSQRRLVPPVTEMAARCKVKDLAAMVACEIEPLQYMGLVASLNKQFQRDPTKAIRGFVAQRMKAFEHTASKSAGVYSVGNELSIADVQLVSIVQAVYKYGLTLDRTLFDPATKPLTTQFTTIQRIMKACELIPAFTEVGIPKVPWKLREEYFAKQRRESRESDRVGVRAFTEFSIPKSSTKFFLPKGAVNLQI